MVKIEKNSFYKKNILDTGATAIAPRYKDLPLTGATTITLKSGVNPLRYVVSGNVPSSPTYGAGELKGGYFRTFVSGVSLSGTNSLPVMELYKVEDGIGPTQGNYDFAYRNADATLPQVGNKVYVMSSYIDGDSAWLTETFDGADKSLGEFVMFGDQGTSTLSFEDIYISPPPLAAKLLFQGGDAFLGQADDNAARNLENYFSSASDNNRIYIKPVKRNKIKGLWTTQNDRRNEKQKWSIYEPYWKWKDIKGHIRFGKTTIATDNADSTKEATVGNTIFDDIAMQSTHGNVWTSGEGNPLVESIVELSTAKKVSGGQSFRMYHLWDKVPNWTFVKNVEATMGTKKINPQVSRASIYNIPEPPPALDMGAFNYNFVTGTAVDNQAPASGGSSDGDDSNLYPGLLEGGHLTDKRLTFPEIDITMNITKLFATPQIEVGSATAQVTWGPSGTIYGYPEEDAQSGPYSTARWFYGAKQVTGTNNVFKQSKAGLNTLLRCVAVTFSNYKADPYPTLDEFLAASLDNNYWVSSLANAAQANYKVGEPWVIDKTTQKMATGVLFQSFRGASEYNIADQVDTQSCDLDQDINSDSIYAMALPMSRYQEANAASTTAADITGLAAWGGFAKFDNIGRTFSGTSTNAGAGAMTLVHDTRIGLSDLVAPSGTQSGTGSKLPLASDNVVSGTPWGDSGSKKEPLWVEIPKDQWFTLKFVFDSQAMWGQSKPYPEGSGSTTGSKVTSSSLRLEAASGGSFSYSQGGQSGDGEDINYNADYGLADPSVQYGVPLRCYIEGAKGNAGIDVSGARADNAVTQKLPYLNMSLPHRGAVLVSGADDTSASTAAGGWLRCNNNFMWNSSSVGASQTRAIQEAAYKCVGEQFPFKYMTIWIQNYRHTEYTETGTAASLGDYSFWRGNYFNGALVADNQADVDSVAVGEFRAADSKLYGQLTSGAGLSAEAEVFVDNIEFKNWNNEHVNHSIEAGTISRHMKVEAGNVLSPATTHFNTGSIYDDDGSSGGGGGGLAGSNYVTATGNTALKMTSMMKGFNASGNWRSVNPGQFLSLGVDDPLDLPLTFVSGARGNAGEIDTGFGGEANIQSGYFLFNNFKCLGNFSSLEKLIPDVAFVSTAPAGLPNNNNHGDPGENIGPVPYNGGINTTLGGQVAGRNYAIYNPVIGGVRNVSTLVETTYPQAVNMRTKQTRNLISGGTWASEDVVEFQFNQKGSNTKGGWVIDNNGELYATNTDNYPARYSNSANWAGMGYIWNTGQTAVVSGTYIEREAATELTGEGKQQMFNGFNWLSVVSGTTQAATDYVLGSGGAVNMGAAGAYDETTNPMTWLSTDGFTQKGFVKIDIDRTSNTGSAAVAATMGEQAWNKWSTFAPRENILCAAKIMAVPGSIGLNEKDPIQSMNQILVDDTSIFNASSDDRYVIFKVNQYEEAWNMLPNSDTFSPSFGGAVPQTFLSGGTTGSPISGNCSGALGFHSELKLSNINAPIQGNLVSLVAKDDIKTTTLYMSECDFNGTITGTMDDTSDLTVGDIIRDFTGAGGVASGTTVASIVNGTTYTMSAANTSGTVTNISMEYTNNPQSTFNSTGLKTRYDGILRADDKTTDLCNEANLHTLWISPLKYWLTLGFFDKIEAANPTDISRSYESVCVINPVTQTVDPNPSLNEAPGDGSNDSDGKETTNTISGSTYNESIYFFDSANLADKGASAVISNPWILEATSAEESSLDLQDYGYGDFNEDGDTGGQAGMKSTWRDKLNYIDIDGIVTGNRAVNAPNQPVVLTLGLSDLMSTSTVTIYSDEYSDTTSTSIYKPTFIWRYHDELPTVSDFEVHPTFDGLKKDVDLYKLTSEDLNSVTFTWKERSEGDIWYRMLMVDNAPIINKYHKARFWAPLNEVPDERAVTTPPTHYWYADPSSAWVNTPYGSSGTFNSASPTGSKVLQTIEGLAGYAPLLLSSSTASHGFLEVAYGTSTNQNTGLNGLDEYTIVLHVTPDADMVNTAARYIYSQGSATASTDFAIYTLPDGSGGPKIAMVGQNVTMTGTSFLPCDGETPTSIIITYKRKSNEANQGPDMQLFINGRREDYVKDVNNLVTATDPIRIGMDDTAGATYSFNGKIEEVIIYEKRYQIVETENQYIYNTSELAGFASAETPAPYEMDVTTADRSLTHNSKIFLFDYHNIRGKEAEEVCESSAAAWRNTA